MSKIIKTYETKTVERTPPRYEVRSYFSPDDHIYQSHTTNSIFIAYWNAYWDRYFFSMGKVEIIDHKDEEQA